MEGFRSRLSWVPSDQAEERSKPCFLGMSQILVRCSRNPQVVAGEGSGAVTGPGVPAWKGKCVWGSILSLAQGSEGAPAVDPSGKSGLERVSC